MTARAVRAPLWLVHALWLIVLMAVSGGLLICIMERSASAQLADSYGALSNELLRGATVAVDLIVDEMRAASRLVEQFQSRLTACNLVPPAADRNAGGLTLLRTLSALGANWLSFGLMQRAVLPGNGTTVATLSDTAKWSWQMALGFGCVAPAHIFAYIDEETAPAFLGYCAHIGKAGELAIDEALAYNGTDWGFTPQEREMLFDAAYDEAFTPVKSLLGVLEFSYRHLIRCGSASNNGAPLALTFASRTIAQLDAVLADTEARALRNGTVGSSALVTFVYERETGLLVTTSVANQSHVMPSGGGGGGEPMRVAAVNASNVLIREAAKMLGAIGPNSPLLLHQASIDKPYYVAAVRYAPARGIDWIVVVAAERTAIVGELEHLVMQMRISVAVVVISFAIISGVGSFCCITVPLRRAKERLAKRAAGERDANADETKEPLLLFSEVAGIQEALGESDKNHSSDPANH